MLGLKNGDKILYCYTMKRDKTKGIIVLGTVVGESEHYYTFRCEECLKDDSGNGLYSFLCSKNECASGGKEDCFKIDNIKGLL